jgi:hypothetical protein
MLPWPALFPARGVGQPASCAVSPRYSGTVFWPALRFRNSAHFASVSSSRLRSTDVGVGHPEEPLPDVRRADARRAQIGGPAGISCVLQVKAYSRQPLPASRASNLLPKRHWRLALGDEAVKSGPEVALVGSASLLPCDRNWLAWARAGPDGAIVGPAGEAEGVAPEADPGEEVALGVASEIAGTDIDNASLVNVACGNKSSCGQIAEPPRAEPVVLIVIRAHSTNRECRIMYDVPPSSARCRGGRMKQTRSCSRQ